jgi:hypothetical protein
VSGAAVVVVAAGILGFSILAGALVLAVRRGQRGQVSEFLCDRCKYNDVRTCSRPERPNATTCPEFKPR